MKQSIESEAKKIKIEPSNDTLEAIGSNQTLMVSDGISNCHDQEVLKYISGFDMKLSVILLKIQLNSIMSRYKYKSEVTPEFLGTSNKLIIFIN